MNILFYTPVNFRCRDIESLAKKYIANGHKVYLLSQCKEGLLHESFKSVNATVGVQVIGSRNKLLQTFIAVVQIVKFCKNHKIDLLFSHLEPTNFVSVLSQYFIKAKVILYRHHVDIASLLGFDKSLTYRLTYRLAKNIIAVSEEAKRYMINHEKVSDCKITQINLGYDFSLYEPLNQNKVSTIREQYPAHMILVYAGSLSEFKRPEIAIELVKRVNNQGLKVILLILGVGERYQELKQLVAEKGLEKNVFFLGYINTIMDYLYAADWLIHPSISEASCVVVKEAGLANLPVMVCAKVGDFDSYLQHDVNSILLEKDNFLESALTYLVSYNSNPLRFKLMGTRLKKDVLTRFSIESTFTQYSVFEGKSK